MIYLLQEKGGGAVLKNFLIVLGVSMMPLIELRGALPIASRLGLPVIPSLVVAMLGNLLPMPFIFMFAQSLLRSGADSENEWLRKFCQFCVKKGKRGGEKLQQKNHASIYLALVFFVGIPLPGTGAWTGTLAASFLGLDFRRTMCAVAGGTLLAGLIMLAISFGLLGQLFG